MTARDWFGHFGRDASYAVRLLRRRPVLSATAIVTLMLGMGGATAVFGLMDALLLRTLPVARPDQLLRLVERRPDGSTTDAFTLATPVQLQRATRTLSGVIAISQTGGALGDIQVRGEKRRAVVQLVSENFFDVLGVPAFRGRVFHQPAPGTPGEPIAVISEEYWRRQYGADVSVLGTTFRQRDRDFTIAGIAPPAFRGVDVDVPVDIWLSIEQVVAPDSPDRTRGRWMRVMGRLEPGATAAHADADSTAILGRPVQLQSGANGYSTLRVRLFQPLVLVGVVVALVLLIACANLANLTLAATLSREREISLRAAIGASRGRIVRQLITESVFLSVVGAALGLGVAYAISGALLAFLPPQQAVALPNLRFTLDARMLGFVTLLSLTTCVLFAVVPALRATGTAAAGALKSGAGLGRGHRSAFSRGLLVGQVLMCTTLLVVASAFVRTVENLRSQEAGYREDQLLVADVGFPRDYSEARRDSLIEDLRTRVAALPGVEVAAFSHVGQLTGSGIEYRIGFPDRPGIDATDTSVFEQRISPGFLRAMATPLVRGREFASSDDEHAPLVVIVNEAFARRFLAGRDPIGVRFFREGGALSGKPMEIVGLVKDAKWTNLRDESPAMYYRPYRQMGGTPVVRLAIRMSEGQRPVPPQDLRGLAQSIDKDIALSNIIPFSEVVNRTLVTERLIAQVSAAFGVFALLIAGIGLYGVLAYNVARRRREIGLRIAIGAQAGAVERMFLMQSITVAVSGVALGIPVAIVITRLASSMLYGLSPYDPISIGVAIAALMFVAVAATYLPARSAARTDPLIVLREE